MYEMDSNDTYPAAAGQPAPFKQPAGRYVNIALVALFVMVTVSLALNLALILALLRARTVALGALDQAVAVTNDIGNQVFSIPVHVDQQVPVSVGVPFEYHDSITVDTTVPISTTVSLPLDLAGQTVIVTLPVKTTVPVKLQVPISLSKTIEVNANVPVKFDTTVEVRLADTPLPGYLSRLRSAIESMR